MLFYIECAGCKRQIPATDNEGVPDIPADWHALSAESNPSFELYACSHACGHRTGYMLSHANPGDNILERHVVSEVSP